MKKTALFPGSFDPFTMGHMDILRSALKMFDRVIVAVGYNSAKSGFFHPELRVQIIKDAVDALFDPYVDFLPYGKPEIVKCTFGNEANLIGALAFHLKRIGA